MKFMANSWLHSLLGGLKCAMTVNNTAVTAAGAKAGRRIFT